MNFLHIWRVFIFANVVQKKISRVFNFAKSTKIREIRENLYTGKLVRLKYTKVLIKSSYYNILNCPYFSNKNISMKKA